MPAGTVSGSGSCGSERYVTSSLIPTLKLRMGFSARRFWNTDMAWPGVKSFDPRP